MPRGMKQHALTALGRRNAPAHPANAGFKDGVTPMVNFRSKTLAVSARGGSEHGLPPPGGGPAWRVVRGKLRHPKVTADACRGLGVDSGDSRAGHKLGLSVGDPYREGAGHCGTTLASSRAGEVGCQVEPLVRSHVDVHTRHDP